MAQKTGSSELAFAAPWLVPSPEYFANSHCLISSLVQRAQDLASGHGADHGASRLRANHRIFVGAEAADTGLVQGNRGSIREVRDGRRTTRDAGCGKVVTALCAGRKHVVDQAGRSLSRNARGIDS